MTMTPEEFARYLSEERRRLIREYRAKAGLSIRAAAKKADVSPTTWQRYESGKVEPYEATLATMRAAVGVPLMMWDHARWESEMAAPLHVRHTDGRETVILSPITERDWDAERTLLVELARGATTVTDAYGEPLHEAYSADVLDVIGLMAQLSPSRLRAVREVALSLAGEPDA